MSQAPTMADPPFVAPRPYCLSCSLAKWNDAGKGVCLASTHEIRKPRWHEIGQAKPTIWQRAPLDDCWRWSPKQEAA